MAARRLIIVLVLLLAASIVAATVAPERTGQIVGVTDTTTTGETTTATEQEPTTTTTPETTAPAPTPEPSGGVARSARIDASVKHPETVRAHAGDQLALAVGADPPRSIAIPSLGLTEFAAEDAPAHFNLLLRTPGIYAITDGDDPSVILGRIRVSKGNEHDRKNRPPRPPSDRS